MNNVGDFCGSALARPYGRSYTPFDSSGRESSSIPHKEKVVVNVTSLVQSDHLINNEHHVTSISIFNIASSVCSARVQLCDATLP